MVFRIVLNNLVYIRDSHRKQGKIISCTLMNKWIFYRNSQPEWPSNYIQTVSQKLSLITKTNRTNYKASHNETVNFIHLQWRWGEEQKKKYQVSLFKIYILETGQICKWKSKRKILDFANWWDPILSNENVILPTGTYRSNFFFLCRKGRLNFTNWKSELTFLKSRSKIKG